jgi:hypothetical protein
VADAFQRGRSSGAEEERQQLGVRVEPHKSTTSEWLGLKKVLSVGYTHQIYYLGLPVGGPQTIVTSAEETWDQDRVDRVIAGASEVAAVCVRGLVEKGVKARLIK